MPLTVLDCFLDSCPIREVDLTHSVLRIIVKMSDHYTVQLTKKILLSNPISRKLYSHSPDYRVQSICVAFALQSVRAGLLEDRQLETFGDERRGIDA